MLSETKSERETEKNRARKKEREKERERQTEKQTNEECVSGDYEKDFSLIHIFLETTKCVSVVRKQTKALRSIISRQTECVRGVYEKRFFSDSYVFTKPQSV